MQFIPQTPARLATGLANWVVQVTDGRLRDGAPGAVIGFDGAAQVGTAQLADGVAEVLRGAGRPVVRASTRQWWRPSALRLELGRQDVDMLLTGWVDAAALDRELITPIATGGSTYITALRDPLTDRSVRQAPVATVPAAVLLLDGPFLLAADLRLDAFVGMSVSHGTLARVLGPDEQWWLDGFARYQLEHQALQRADVVVSYDHADAPAAGGLEAVHSFR